MAPDARGPRSGSGRTASADRYWARYVASLPPERRPAKPYVEAFYFGIAPEDAPEIVPLVLAGTKSATGSLLWAYEADGKPLPAAGDHWIATAGADDPVCIIETTEVRIVPFDEVGADWARAGGEGDRSLAFPARNAASHSISVASKIDRSQRTGLSRWASRTPSGQGPRAAVAVGRVSSAY